jgi:hypothetical protein
VSARFLIPASVALLAGAGAAVLLKPPARQIKAIEARGIAVPLTLSRKDGSWQVDWDHYTPLVQTASYGTLSIHDGPKSTLIHLTSPQLKNGDLIYLGLNEAVRFDLEVYGASPAEAAQPLPPTPPVAAADLPAPPAQKMHSARQKRARSTVKKTRGKARSSRRTHRRK